MSRSVFVLFVSVLRDSFFQSSQIFCPTTMYPSEVRGRVRHRQLPAVQRAGRLRDPAVHGGGRAGARALRPGARAVHLVRAACGMVDDVHAVLRGDGQPGGRAAGADLPRDRWRVDEEGLLAIRRYNRVK